MYNLRTISMVCLMASLGLVGGSFGESVPQLMNYQGMLTDASGEPLATGEYKLTLKLWNHVTEAEPGNLEWTEVHDSVPVVRGQFNVILGGTTSLEGKFEGAERYISIAIGDAADISPRQKILSAPYALRAQHADTADSSTQLNGTPNNQKSGTASKLITATLPTYEKFNELTISEFQTSGQPVFVYLTGFDNSNLSHDNTTGVFVQIRRVNAADPTAAPVEVVGVQFKNTNGGGDGRVNRIPPSAVWGIDFPPAGTYTYEVWLSRTHDERAETQGVRLAVFEVGG